MKVVPTFWKRGILPAVICVAGLALAGCGGGDAKKATAGTNTTSAKKASAPTAANSTTTNVVAKRAAVFTLSKNLRDPFYPNSKTPPPGVKEQQQQPEAAPIDVTTLLREGFQGVMGAGETRLAVVHNVILEPGRRTEIPLTIGGTRKMVRVRCREVLANGVVLEIDGQAQPVTITRAPRR